MFNMKKVIVILLMVFSAGNSLAVDQTAAGLKAKDLLITKLRGCLNGSVSEVSFSLNEMAIVTAGGGFVGGRLVNTWKNRILSSMSAGEKKDFYKRQAEVKKQALNRTVKGRRLKILRIFERAAGRLVTGSFTVIAAIASMEEFGFVFDRTYGFSCAEYSKIVNDII